MNIDNKDYIKENKKLALELTLAKSENAKHKTLLMTIADLIDEGIYKDVSDIWIAINQTVDDI